MYTSVRRLAGLATLALLAALVAPLVLSTPASAETGEAAPGPRRVDASQLAAGGTHSCAIMADGSLRCWGDNSEGQLAQGNTDDVGDQPGESTVRVNLSPGRTAVAVAAGDRHTCAILDTGRLRCWGDNSEGQLAQGNTEDIGDQPGESTVAVDLGPGRTAVAVATGDAHTCAILDIGQLRCWGGNPYGQLGQGHAQDIGDSPSEPVAAVDLGGRTAVAVTAGGSHTCAILDTGQLRCWGHNGEGQLAQGNTDHVGDSPGESTVTVPLPPGRKATAAAAGALHTCAVLDNGQVHCWGWNMHGQLGQGSTSRVGAGNGKATVPVNLGPGRTAVGVTTGAHHSCAILDNAQLRCWGSAGFGQVGQGGNNNVGDEPGETTAPVNLGPGRVAVAVSAGTLHTCAVSADGQLRCWGYNDNGELGQGSRVAYGVNPGEVPHTLPPVQLGGLPVGRDSDGDGVRDAADACPSKAGVLANGCPAPPQALLKGKKVVLDTVLTKKRASAKCPAKATVTVKTKTKKGRLTVTKRLKTRRSGAGCALKGKVGLGAKPKKSAKTKVTITGKKVKTQRLVAVRL